MTTATPDPISVWELEDVVALIRNKLAIIQLASESITGDFRESIGSNRINHLTFENARRIDDAVNGIVAALDGATDIHGRLGAAWLDEHSDR